LRGQFQVAHRHVTVIKAEKALTVAFAGRPGFRGMTGSSGFTVAVIVIVLSRCLEVSLPAMDGVQRLS
jgi:hypothetical protein